MYFLNELKNKVEDSVIKIILAGQSKRRTFIDVVPQYGNTLLDILDAIIGLNVLENILLSGKHSLNIFIIEIDWDSYHLVKYQRVKKQYRSRKVPFFVYVDV